MFKSKRFLILCFVILLILSFIFPPISLVLFVMLTVLFVVKLFSGIKNGTLTAIDFFTHFNDYVGRDTLFYYKSYAKEINTDLNTFKHNLEGLINKCNGKYKLVKYKDEDYIICAHNTGIYIINFDNTAEKICGIADDESFSTLDDRYVDVGSAYKKNKALEFKKAFVKTLNMPEELADKIVCWTIHSSYCSYNIVPSFYGEFRHLNTLNFESYLNNCTNSPVELVSNNNIDILCRNLDKVKIA